MALSQPSFFWTGKVSEAAPGHAGPYNQDTLAMFSQLIFAERSGVLSGLTVSENSPTGKSVLVAVGKGIIRGLLRVVQTADTRVLSIADNTSGNPRIDRVVLRADWTAQTITLAVLQGTPGVTPVAPALTQTDGVLWEEGMADVAVANGFTQILNANLTDIRRMAEVPGNDYVHVLNKAGVALAVGDVVVWDDANRKAVKTTTIADDPNVAGVVADAMADNAEGRICTGGLALVQVAGAVSIGHALATSTTTKLATNQGANAFARALASTSGAGLVLAQIGAKARYPNYAISRITTNPQLSTSFAVVSGFTISNFVTSGGPLDIDFQCRIGNAAGTVSNVAFDVKIDGVYVGQTTLGYSNGLAYSQMAISTGASSIFIKFSVRANVAPGTHTIELWAVSVAGGNSVTIQGQVNENHLEVKEVLN